MTGVAAHTIDIAWTAGPSEELDGFRVTLKGTRENLAAHEDERSFDASVRSASLTGLRSGDVYAVAIVAFNGVGPSARSDPVSATVPIVPEKIPVFLQRQLVDRGADPLPCEVPSGVRSGASGASSRDQHARRDRAGVRINIVKLGHSSGECFNPDAVVVLPRGQTTTPEQLTAIYGVARPPYSAATPISVLACVGFAANTPLLDSVVIELTIISDGS